MSPSKKEKKRPQKRKMVFQDKYESSGTFDQIAFTVCWKNNSYLETTIFIWTNLLFIFPKIYGWRVCNSLRITSNDESVLKEKQLVPISRFDTSYKRVMIVCNIISSTFFLPMGGLVSLFFFPSSS